MCETRDQPLTAPWGLLLPGQQWSRHVWAGPPVSGESQVSPPPWAGTGLCAQKASPCHRISHQPPFTRTPGWAGLTKQTSWTSLEWFGRAPPRLPAPSRGYSVAESVGKSRWAGGRQALCAAGPGPRVSERLEWIHLCRRPASCPGPTHPSRSPRHGACGLALRRSLNLPLGSELKVQKRRGLKYRGVHPGTRDIQPQDGTSAVPVAVVTQQPRLTQAEGARPRAALGSQGPSLGETSIRQPPGGHQSLAPQHLLFPAFTQSVLFTQVLCSCRHFERQRSKRAPLLPGQAGHTPALEPRGSSALPCSVLAVCVCACDISKGENKSAPALAALSRGAGAPGGGMSS